MTLTPTTKRAVGIAIAGTGLMAMNLTSYVPIQMPPMASTFITLFASVLLVDYVINNMDTAPTVN